MTTRIYKVTGGDTPKLVRASSQSQAVNHVVKGVYRAAVATQADLIDLLPGTKVERASDET